MEIDPSTRTPLDTHRVSFSGRGNSLFDPSWIRILVERLGGSIVPLGPKTTVVLLGRRPARKTIDRLRKTSPNLIELDFKSFVATVRPPPPIIAKAFATKTGREWLRSLQGLRLKTLSVHGQVVTGELSGYPDLDITGADLRGVTAAGSLNLHGSDADLRGANLSGLSGSVNLQNCNLRGAHLNNINLYNSVLSNVNLQSAQLSGTLKRVMFKKCDLREAQLGPLVWGHANREGFIECKMEGLDLTKTAMPRNLRGTSLVHADVNVHTVDHLERADCRNVRFHTSNLDGLDLRTTRLEGADLSQAQKHGVLIEPLEPVPEVVLDPELLQRFNTNEHTSILPFQLPEENDISLRVAFLHPRKMEVIFSRPEGPPRTITFNTLEEGLAALLHWKARPRWEQLEVYRSDDGTRRPSKDADGRTIWGLLLNTSPPAFHRSHPQITIDGDPFTTVLADRNNEAAWWVLADRLTEAGDGRGALIARELAATGDERTQITQYHSETKRDVILGTLAKDKRARLSLRRGFVHEVSVDSKVSDALLRKLAAHDSTRLLQQVSITSLAKKLRGLKALLEGRPVESLCIFTDCAPLLEVLGTCPMVTYARLLNPGPVALHPLFPNLKKLEYWGEQPDLRGLMLTEVLGTHHPEP